MSDIDISSIHSSKNLQQEFYHDKCDKYDYLIAVGCGAIAGMIDIFLVGQKVVRKIVLPVQLVFWKRNFQLIMINGIREMLVDSLICQLRTII